MNPSSTPFSTPNSPWKSPVLLVSLFWIGFGQFILWAGMRSSIANVVVPISLAFTAVGMLGGMVNGQVYSLQRKVEVLEDALRTLKSRENHEAG